MSAAKLLSAVCALALAGCSSQWYPGNEVHDIARTDLYIESEPSNATVVFDGKTLPETTPLLMPIEYDHTITQYERQTNAGQAMRESMSLPVAIIATPVWLIASFFHSKETMKRHQYGGNKHVVSAYLPGHDDAQETITLEGEAKKTLRFVLPVSK